MNYFKKIDYKKLIMPTIVIVVGICSFFYQKKQFNNIPADSKPVIKEEVVLKNDAKLSSIKIDGVDFEFKEDVLEYDIVVGNDTETLNITAITTDGENADVKLGNGNKLLEGNNKITVDVKNSNKVVKYVFNVYRKKVTLQCPDNTTLEGDKCVTKNIIQNAKVEYSCPSGSTLEGTRCMKTETKEASKYESCETGYKKVGSKCQKTDTVKKVITDFTCPERQNSTWHFDGTKCVYEVIYNAQQTFKCPNGNLNGGTCEIMVGQVPPEEQAYQECDSDNNCVTKILMSCPGGSIMISSTMCAFIERIPAEEQFECLQGGHLINKYTCCKEEYIAPSNVKYGCPSGYSTTSSGSCEKLLTKETFKNLSCSKDFEFQNGKCIKNSSTSATEKLSCPNGLKIDKETKKCYEELLSLPTKVEEEK